MKKFLFLGAGIAALVCQQLVFSKEELDPCKEQKTTGDMTDCARRHQDEAERQMKLVYRRLLCKLKDNPKYEKDVQMAQSAWLTFRHKHCYCWYRQYAGGTAGPAVEMGCYATLTRERTVQLQMLLKSVE